MPQKNKPQKPLSNRENKQKPLIPRKTKTLIFMRQNKPPHFDEKKNKTPTKYQNVIKKNSIGIFYISSDIVLYE